MKRFRIFLLALVALTLFNCSEMLQQPLVIGHRGAMGHETENTLASVQKAIDLGADMVEIDVFKISSGEIMVFHDKRVERLTNGGGSIEEYNFVDVKKLILDGNHNIPTLQEVLRLVDKQLSLNIELKGANTADRVNFIIETYVRRMGWKLDQFIISSFNWDELRALREFNPDIQIAVLVEGDPLEAIAVAKELNAKAINPDYLHLDEKVVDSIHNAGFKVYTWTVNAPAEIRRMKQLGVDGIISDFPERIQ